MHKNVNALTEKEVLYYYDRYNEIMLDILTFQKQHYISVSPSKDGTEWFAFMPFQWSRTITMPGSSPRDALLRLWLSYNVGSHIEVEEDNQ